MNPKLTIGMAVYDDFHGVYFTLQALRLYHDAEILKDTELVIVDNHPGTPDSQFCKELVTRLNGLHSVKYVDMPTPVGTSCSRNKVFETASGEYVLCIDCHVLLEQFSLETLLDYYTQHPGTNDLLSGPLVYDTLVHTTTHFDPIWRAEMYGIWGSARCCKCGFGGVHFSLQEELGPNNVPMNRTKAFLIPTGLPINSCFKCGQTIPVEEWNGHERKFESYGYSLLADQDEPFEIPGCGLGLFSCRKEAWLGFNEHARGFGGEEMYIHEKYRQAGFKSICIPTVRWVHRFGRPEGVKYPLTRWNKIRNYVLEFNELGLDLQPIYDHFVASKFMPEWEWQGLIEDPIGQELGVKKAATMPETAPTLDELYVRAKNTPSDINEHVEKLRELALQSDSVVELTSRAGVSTTGLLAGTPKSFISIVTNESTIDQNLAAVPLPEDVVFHSLAQDPLAVTIECDLLFIDTKHTAEQLRQELEKHADNVHKYIALHDTHIYGNTGEDGGPGLLVALKEFLNKNQEWKPIYHVTNNHGFTVISRNPDPAKVIQLFTPEYGPGTELKAILAKLGILAGPHCACNKRAEDMNKWGVKGCNENFDIIVGWIKEGAPKWGWTARMAAAAKAVTSGVAFDIKVKDWLDPYPSLIRLAIDTSEQKELKAQTEQEQEQANAN